MVQSGPIREFGEGFIDGAKPSHPKYRVLHFSLALLWLVACTRDLFRTHTLPNRLELLATESVLIPCCLQLWLRLFRPLETARRAADIPARVKTQIRRVSYAIGLGGVLVMLASLVNAFGLEDKMNYLAFTCALLIPDALSDLIGDPSPDPSGRAASGGIQRLDLDPPAPVHSSHWGDPRVRS